MLLVALFLLQIGTGNLLFSETNENKNVVKKIENTVNQNTNTIATTESGKIQGFIQDEIYTYLGVPYARAERFMAPKKVEKWNGIKQTVTFGTYFSQGESMVSSGGWFAGPKLEMSENSHNLNIWTPGIKDGKKRPVMVWLHGGGFRSGSSAENYIFDGKNLSKKGDVWSNGEEISARPSPLYCPTRNQRGRKRWRVPAHAGVILAGWPRAQRGIRSGRKGEKKGIESGYTISEPRTRR